MRAARTGWLTILWVLGFVGCNDISTGIDQANMSERIQQSTGALDPPKNWPVSLHDVGAYIFMPIYGFNDRRDEPREAQLFATMQYSAYHARIGATATLRKGGMVIPYSFAPIERHTFYDYYHQSHSAEWPVMVSGYCGHILEAQFQYEAWWRGLGPTGEIVLDPQRDTRSTSRIQQNCPPPTSCNEEDNLFSASYNPASANEPICDSGPGGGGTGTENPSCTDEYIIIEVSYDNGETWHLWWQGWVKSCE